jgi:FimV-like protein
MKKIVLGFFCALSISASGVYAESYGPTTKNDSLLIIAAKVKPSEDVSVEQAALGIYYYNQRAFSRDNINSLMRGKTLEIPSSKIMTSITKGEASEEVMEHNAKWTQKDKVARSQTKKVQEFEPEDPMLEARRISGEFDPGREVAVEEIIKEAQNLDSKPVPVPVADYVEEIKVSAQDTETVKPMNSTGEQQDSGIFAEWDKTLENIDGIEVTNVSVTELDDRLAKTEAKTDLTQNQVASIDERMTLLETKINSLNNVEKKLKSCAIGRFILWLQNYYDQASDYIGPVLFMIIMVLVILILLVLLIYMFIPKRKDKHLSYPHDVSDDDFAPIEHEEDATSKLNLAHAYMEMGDKDKAKELLNQVLLHGSDIEQLEAKDLLEKMRNDDL